MPEIIRHEPSSSASPPAASQSVGASLATFGFARSMPLLRGSQDCTALARIDFLRQLQPPDRLPLARSGAGLGRGDTLPQGGRRRIKKSRPELITVLKTHRSETQGTDIERCVREFRARYPEFASAAVVAVNAPDATGCLETGYAAAVTGIVDELVPAATDAGTRPGVRLRQLNVLASSMLTPGDLEQLRELIETFGLRPVFVPDLADALDRHLAEADFSPVSIGGTPVDALATLGNAAATLVVGPSLHQAADLLETRTGVPTYRLDHLYGLAATDALMHSLRRIAGTPLPERLERQRAQLLDTMVGARFVLDGLRVAIAADPDQLNGLCHFVEEMGGEVVAAIAAGHGPALALVPAERLQLGGLGDLEATARAYAAELLIGQSHATPSAERLGLPLLRCGFPLHGPAGDDRPTWIGYAAARQLLSDLAKTPLADRHAREITPYRSRYDLSRADETTARQRRQRAMALVPDRPPVDSNPDESPMHTSLKLAFATDDVRQVNQHFGSARTFAVYAVDPDRVELLEAAELSRLGLEDHEDPLAALVERLAGCAAVYCEAIGTSATHQLMANGIRPIKVNRGAHIAELIHDFQNALKQGASVGGTWP